jgi:uncharacterized protein
MKRKVVLCLLALACITPVLAQSPAPAKPKVRAITAFVRISPQQFQSELAPALAMLRAVKAEFERAGYEVETIRITTQPFAELTQGMSQPDALAFLKSLDDFSVKENFLPNVGPATPETATLLARVLATLPNIEASMIIAAADGIHWNAVRATAHLVKYVAANSPRSQGTFNFTATAMLGPYAPFFPGSYHTGAGKQFSIGFEGAGVVADVFARHRGQAEAATADLTKALNEHVAVADRIGRQIAQQTGWEYMGVDPTPAPLADVSIATAIEKFTGAPFGSSGTLTAAAIITRAVKQVSVKQVGYSGLMVPIMEDKVLAQRWAEGTFNIDSLLAYSAVCGTGLDTVPLPGDVSEEQLARILGDVASLAVKWNKPLSARLQPVPGKKAGDRTEFHDPYLFNTVLQKLP